MVLEIVIDNVRYPDEKIYTGICVSNGVTAKVILWKHEKGDDIYYTFGMPTYRKTNGKRGPLGKHQYEFFAVQSRALLEAFENKLREAGWEPNADPGHPDNKLAVIWSPPPPQTQTTGV